MKILIFLFSFTILKPRLTYPFFLTKDEIFYIFISHSDTPYIENAFIKNFFDSTSILVNKVENVSQDTWRIEGYFYNFPSEGLYDLYLIINGELEYQKNAIKIIDSFKKNIKIIHMSDIHIGASGVVENYLKAIEISNLLNPDIVIHTGDIGEIHDSSYYFEYMDYTSKFCSPVFTIPGNHDYYYILGLPDTTLIYEQIVNPYLNFYFLYGDYLFILLNTGKDNIPQDFASRCYGLTEAQISWIENILRDNFYKKIKIAAMHGPYYSQRNSGIDNAINKYGKFDFLNLCSAFKVNMVLSGHTHVDEIFDRNGNLQTGDIKPLDGTIFATVSTTTKNNPENCSIRFIEIEDGVIKRYTVDRDGNGKREGSSSIHLTDFYFIYHYPNDGTSNYQIVEVYNNIYESFKDLRLYLYMLPGNIYSITGGEILRQRNGFLEIKVDSIPSRGTIYVEVYASQSFKEINYEKSKVKGEVLIDVSGRKIKYFKNRGIFFKKENKRMFKVLKIK